MATSIDTEQTEKADRDVTFKIDNQPLNQQMKIVKQFVDSVIQQEQQWTDSEFPPVLASLANHEDPSDAQTKMQDIQWKRALDINPNFKLFDEGISPNDINQGSLGNCYYLAVLSAMAEHPENIMARFYTKTINKAGIYMMIFYINGLEQAVIVDDHIPVRGDTPCFASTKSGELWVMLLEKAWAKIQGTYQRTEAGSPNTAAFHLLGVPNMYYYTSETDKQKLWQKIAEADRRGFVIDSVTKGEGENEDELGIISGHVYTLISAYEVLDQGNSVKLLKLRNPWGCGEWKGNWSDNSNKWTPELKQQLEFSNKDDGIFFISLEDYMLNFDGTSISVNYDSNKYRHSSIVHDFSNTDKSTAFFTFELQHQVQLSEEVFAISCIQQGNRIQSNRNKSRQDRFMPSEFGIMLMTDDGKWINASHGEQNQFCQSVVPKEGTLLPGKYIVHIDPTWDKSADYSADYKKVLIDIYSTESVTIEVIPYAEGLKCLENALKHVAKAIVPDENKKYIVENDPDYGKDIYQVSDIKYSKCWYGFIYTNNSSRYQFKQEIEVQLEGLEIFEKDTCNVNIEAGSDDITILRRTQGKCSYSMSSQVLPRELSENEMIAKAQEQEINAITDNVNYQMFNSLQGTCILVKNTSQSDDFQIQFTFENENLKVKGSDGTTVTLDCKKEGGQAVCFLVPIVPGEPTSVSFSMSCQQI